MSLEQILTRLNWANDYAYEKATCEKVKVGSLIIDQHGRVHLGANRTMPGECSGIDNCQIDGHCTSTIHSEIDAIINAKTDLIRSTIYVTRYPCENCARAIVAAGITQVLYGRQREISDDTRLILGTAGVSVIHVPEFDEEDVWAKS